VGSGRRDRSGWKFSSNKSTNQINIEEQSASVKTTMSTQVFTVEGIAAEDVSRVIAVVYNMLIANVAAGTGNAGYETLTPTDLILEYAVALIMSNAQATRAGSTSRRQLASATSTRSCVERRPSACTTQSSRATATWTLSSSST